VTPSPALACLVERGARDRRACPGDCARRGRAVGPGRVQHVAVAPSRARV